MIPFLDRLKTAQEAYHSSLAVGFTPALEKMPIPMQRYDNSFLPFGKAIIDATHDLVCAYIFDLGAYLALGAAGAIALERTIAYVPTPLIKILHGAFATSDYVRAVSDSAFAVDAVTLTVNTPEVVAAYAVDIRCGVFIDAGIGLRSEPLLKLRSAHPGQVGVYTTSSEPRTLGLLEDGCAELRWHTEDVTLASRTEDFQEAARSAALARRVAI